MDAIFYFTLAATVVYAVGTIGVTMIGNVLLNNTLEALDLSTFTAEDYKNTRLAFEEKWNNFNLLRTLSAMVSFVLILIAFAKN